MYALIVSTDRRNKEPKKGPRKNPKKQIQQNKIRSKNRKHKTQKITKGGEPRVNSELIRVNSELIQG